MYCNAREYLEEIRALKGDIERLKKTLDQWESAVGASAINYSPDRVQTSYRQDKLEMDVINNLERRDKVKAKLEESITVFVERQEQAIYYINQIDSEEQKEVLTLRYIECLKWSEILEERCCDNIGSQYDLHKRALISLQKILDRDLIGTI